MPSQDGYYGIWNHVIPLLMREYYIFIINKGLYLIERKELPHVRLKNNFINVVIKKH